MYYLSIYILICVVVFRYSSILVVSTIPALFGQPDNVFSYLHIRHSLEPLYLNIALNYNGDAYRSVLAVVGGGVGCEGGGAGAGSAAPSAGAAPGRGPSLFTTNT